MSKQWSFTNTGNFFKLKESVSGTFYYISCNTATCQIYDVNSFTLKVIGENISEVISWQDIVTPAGATSLENALDLISPIINIASGGGGGMPTYAQASPSNTTVGGLVAGTSLTGLGLDVILADMLVSYLAPAFTSFSISGQSTAVEVGTTLSGSKTFTWSTSNSTNINTNSISILDITGSTTLASGLANTGSHASTIATVTNNTPASYQWQVQGTNTHSSVFSSNFSVNWYYRSFYGTSASSNLNAAAIQALTSNALESGFAGTYSFAAGNYKFICYADAFGSPTASTGFKDTSTGFVVAMATSTDDAFFSNIQNGWYYGLVSVTNGLGVTENYRVYRTQNSLGGSINIQVS